MGNEDLEYIVDVCEVESYIVYGLLNFTEAEFRKGLANDAIWELRRDVERVKGYGMSSVFILDYLIEESEDDE